MEGSYPILIDGVQTGSLTVTREGLMTVFEAVCADPGGLVRLAVYGADGTGYLGVMVPEGGRLHLKKRFSRAALEGFPAEIRYAAPVGQPPVRETPAEEAAQYTVPPDTAEPEAEQPSAGEAEQPSAGEAEQPSAGEAEQPSAGEAEQPSAGEAEQPAEPESEREERPAADPEAECEPKRPVAEAPPAQETASMQEASSGRETQPVQETADGINWFSTPEGILVGTDGVNDLVAIAADDVRLGMRGRGMLRQIEGKRYMIFRAQNGVASIR